jgi:hypothetical protein
LELSIHKWQPEWIYLIHELKNGKGTGKPLCSPPTAKLVGII